MTMWCVYTPYVIKLGITAQYGPVILVILYATRIGPREGGSMMLVTGSFDKTGQRRHTLSTCTLKP